MSISRQVTVAGIIAGLLAASAAIAGITVGQSNTSLSNDVAYTLVTLNRPSETVASDVLVASISLNGGSAGVITPPNGWTLIARADNDPNISLASYHKVVGPSEPASYTWIISPQTRAVGGITRYSGVDTTIPIDVVATSSGRGTVATAPSVTTTGTNERILASFATNTGTNNSPFFSTTTGMTKRYNVKNTPFGPTATLEDIVQAIVGATGSFSSSFTNSPRDWVAQTIALRQFSGLQIGLAGYWKLDETSGDAHAAFGTPAFLYNNGGTTYGPGIINNGLITDGTNKYVSAGASGTDVIFSNSDFSVNMWTKFAFGGINAAVSLYGQSGSTRSWIFCANCYGGVTFLPATSIEIPITESWTSASNTWYMITMTYSASTGATNFYVNGSQLGVTHTGPTGLPNGFNGPFAIGTWDPADNGGMFNGTTDEVGVWKRELSSTEISQLYNGGAGLPYPF